MKQIIKQITWLGVCSLFSITSFADIEDDKQVKSSKEILSGTGFQDDEIDSIEKACKRLTTNKSLQEYCVSSGKTIEVIVACGGESERQKTLAVIKTCLDSNHSPEVILTCYESGGNSIKPKVTCLENENMTTKQANFCGEKYRNLVDPRTICLENQNFEI